MEINQEFSRLTTKFLFLNCNDGQAESSSHELNLLLNDLNSLEYQNQKLQDRNAALRLLKSFNNIPSNEETLVAKSCCLIVILVNKQKIQLPPTDWFRQIEWLLKCLNFNFRAMACDILSTMQALFKSHPKNCKQVWDRFLSADGLLLKLLENGSVEQKKSDKYDANSSEEISVSVMLCIEALLSYLDESDEAEDMDEFLAIIGTKILDVLYSNRIKFKNSIHLIVFSTSAINTLYKIGSQNRDWLENRVGEILGISKAFMHSGLPDAATYGKPEKVLVSQQAVLEPTASSSANKGGKVAKTRKPRTINKSRKNDAKNKNPAKTDDFSKQFGFENQLKADFDNAVLSSFNRTSESDFSESETGRSQNERHKEAKLRLSAISLIALIAKQIEKRLIYGYWHSIFPSETAVHSSKGLLNTAIRDPNPRCRIAALQAASLLLYGSKSYLIQAESSEKAPSTFMPFSVSLGNMIIATYDALTQALSTESSLPVITQILKCLTVLIQATPFHRLKSGFVANFVKYIRRLVHHKDPTIQVAALMVMEFLISIQEITPEISECVGIQKQNFNANRKNQNQLNDTGANEIIGAAAEEERLDSDYEDEEPSNFKPGSSEQNSDNSAVRMSWLLQKVLENLGIVTTDLKKTTTSTTPVRIECLQVLSAMAPHFILLKDHLEVLAKALDKSINDPLPEVRLYSGKSLDVIGHSINTFLLEKGTTNPTFSDELRKCLELWIFLLPSVVEKINDPQQSSTLKAVLCDFLSNIGVHVFERLPHENQIQLISLLSGIASNEENTVKAAAVRALAVYALFPSLRDDLCFIENTAEYILILLKDSNLYVRVKASWSMGNISDALIANSADSKFDRISDNLLDRMLESGIASSTDNDKIRSNAVRTLGNLLRLITSEHLNDPKWRLLCLSAIEKLIHNISTGGNAKVKWNSCYAIGTLMKNPSLFATFSDFNWQETVFTSLSNTIINNTNFKVRINGAAALMSILQREHFGSHLTQIWSSLLSALEQSDNLTDFNEYKHRDNLQEQLCLCLSHVINLSTTDDYPMLRKELFAKLESTKQNWIRVVNRVLPENSAPLIACAVRLKEHLADKNGLLNNEQKNSIQILSSCFVSPNEYV